MSTTWFSRIIVGVPLKDIYYEEDYKATVTKYDPDSGKPYVTVVEKIRRRFGNQVPPDLVYLNGKAERNFGFVEALLDVYFPFPSLLGIEKADIFDHGLVGLEITEGTLLKSGAIDSDALKRYIDRVQGYLIELGHDHPVSVYSQLAWR